MIDACLRSVRDIVDEIIVVDTGSTDDTPARARRAGAKLVEVSWRDDFAWARNVSISHATGDWVLVLDADERVVVRDAKTLRRSLEQAAFHCGLLRLHDARSTEDRPADVLAGRARLGDPQRVPRLLRRMDDLAYVGVIHEDLGPWIVKHGRRVAALDIDVVHFGAAREVYSAKGKFERNVRLLTDLAARSPEDPTALGYLAHQYLGQNRLADARAVTEEGWRRVAFVERSTGYRPSILRLAEARAQVQFKLGDPRGALDTVARCRRVDGPHYDLDFIAGCALESLAACDPNPAARARLLDGASTSFKRCVEGAGVIYLQAFVEGSTGWAARARLGGVALVQGRHAVARDAFLAVLREKPDHIEARLGLVESSLAEGDAKSALRQIEDLARDERVRSRPDPWVLAAGACEALGALADMASFIARARAAGHDYVAPHRRVQHGERLAALAMYDGKPLAAPGLVGAIGALLARAPVGPRDVGYWPSKRGVVELLVINLARSGHLDLIEPLFEPRADAVVPGVTGHVRDAVARLGIGLEYVPPPPHIVVRGDDATFIEDALATHPKLGALVGTTAPSSGDPFRLVWAGAPSDAPTSGVVAFATARRLMDQPPRECDRLLASLGEADARPLVRFVLDRYQPFELRPRRPAAA